MVVKNIDDLAIAAPLHEKWLRGEEGGERLVCTIGADLRGADLREADLRGAILSEAIIPFSAHIDPRGYTFSWSFNRAGNGKLLFYCGCRIFTYEEAKAHWLGRGYPDKQLGAAKMRVVDFIKSMFEDGMLLVTQGES